MNYKKKKMNVERTINAAGEAYHNRNKAEEELNYFKKKLIEGRI